MWKQPSVGHITDQAIAQASKAETLSLNHLFVRTNRPTDFTSSLSYPYKSKMKPKAHTQLTAQADKHSDAAKQ